MYDRMLEPQAHDGLVGKNVALLDQLRQLAFVPLADAYEAILSGLPGQLLSAAGGAGADSLDLIDAVREVRRRREAMLARFRGHLANTWQMLEAGRPISVEHKLADGDADHLSLVSNHELEVRLAVRSLADELAARWKPELMRLSRYLGLLSGGLRLTEDTLPFGPQHIGVAIYESLSACTLTPTARKLIVKLCEAELHTRTGALYSQIQTSLAGLLRESTGPRPRGGVRRWIPRAVLNSAAEQGESEDWIARFFVQWENDPAAAAKRARAALSEHVGGEVESLPPALHALLQRARISDEASPGPGSGKRVLSQRELLSVLSLMQSMPNESLAPFPSRATRLSQRLKWEVLAGAGRLGVDSASIRLGTQDEDTIDLVCMLLEVMLAESHLQGRPRQLMLQLPTPYIKVALVDRELFLSDQHPARRLLNLLADASERCIGQGDAEHALLGEIEIAVAAILRDFSEDVQAFAPILKRFGEYYAAYLRKVQIAERRATELHRAQERRDDARGYAEAQLQARLADVRMPPGVVGFLRGYWVPYISALRLRGEAAGKDLEQGLAALDQLSSAVRQDELHGPDTPWLATWMPWLQRMLSQQGLDAAALSSALQSLQQSLYPTAPAAVGQDEAVTAAEPGAAAPPVDGLVADALDAPVEAGEIDLVTAEFFRALPMGTWLDFVDRNGRIRAGKLNWISPISARLMFVDKLGSRLCVASAEELAVMAHLDRLRLHREDDAFYSAMAGAIEQLAH
jgi:hypothetical protein